MIFKHKIKIKYKRTVVGHDPFLSPKAAVNHYDFGEVIIFNAKVKVEHKRSSINLDHVITMPMYLVLGKI